MRKVHIIGDIPANKVKPAILERYDFNSSLEEADFVFIWITPSNEEWGIEMLKELLWIGKRVFAASPEYLEGVDNFFGVANYRSDLADPVEALEFFTLTVLMLEIFGNLCESPIEKMFWDEISWLFRGTMPQVEVDRYRLDFGIKNFKVAIEIDGHDYHRSKIQRTRDAERQRYLEHNGWRVIRFTGTEVFNNARQCAVDAVVLICKWLTTNNEKLLTE